MESKVRKLILFWSKHFIASFHQSNLDSKWVLRTLWSDLFFTEPIATEVGLGNNLLTLLD